MFGDLIFSQCCFYLTLIKEPETPMIQFTYLAQDFRKTQRPPIWIKPVTQDLLTQVIPIEKRARPSVRSTPVPLWADRKHPQELKQKSSMELPSADALNMSISPPLSSPITPINNPLPKNEHLPPEESTLQANEYPLVTPIASISSSSLSLQKQDLRQGKKPDNALPQTRGVGHEDILQDLFAKNPHLPPQSLVLGVCDDGLPIALDLSDSAPGALLVIGDNWHEQVELLRLAVTSIACKNSPRSVQFLVISQQPESWESWIAEKGFQRHCLAVVSGQETSTWVLQAADWTEQRRLGQRSGPPILLVIDSLSFLPKLPYDIRLNFDWMVKEGPCAQVWTLAAISTDLAVSIGSRFLRPFGIHIFGWTASPDVFTRLATPDAARQSQLPKPGQYMAHAGGQWIQFALPGQ